MNELLKGKHCVVAGRMQSRLKLDAKWTKTKNEDEHYSQKDGGLAHLNHSSHRVSESGHPIGEGTQEGGDGRRHEHWDLDKWQGEDKLPRGEKSLGGVTG